MREVEFYGSWWVPDDPTNEIAGLLTLDSDGIRLTLYGEWKSRETDASEEKARYVDHHYPIIYGLRHSDQKLVTLLDVRGRILRLPFRTFGRHVFTVDMGLLGHRLSTPDKFSRISFELDYLKAWAQPPMRTERTAADWDVLHVNTRPFVLAECLTPDDYKVTLRSGLHGSEGASTVELHEFCAFDIDAPHPSGREGLITHVRTCRDLLTLTLGRPVRVSWMNLHVSGIEGSVDAIYQFDEPLESGLLADSQARNNVLNYQMPTLLTPWNAPGDEKPGIPTDAILRRWFKIYPLAANTLDLLLAPYSMDEMLPHHRFSSMFAAVEELHKCLEMPKLAVPRQEHKARKLRVQAILDEARIDLEEKDSEWLAGLIKTSRNDRSLAQKIEDIFASSGEVGRGAVTVAPDLFRKTARSRGQISHGSSGSESERAARLSYELVLEYTLRVVIISHLLNRRDRDRFFRAAAERRMFQLMLRRLAATEASSEQ